MANSKRRRPARSVPVRPVDDLDDMNVPGNDEFEGEDGILALTTDGVATLRPASFDRLPAGMRDLSSQLMVLVGHRRNLAAEIDSLVAHMRTHGVSWGVIGWCVGTSSEAARQRWGQTGGDSGGT